MNLRKTGRHVRNWKEKGWGRNVVNTVHKKF